MTTIEPEHGRREQLLATAEELQTMSELIEKYPAEAQLIMAALERRAPARSHAGGLGPRCVMDEAPVMLLGPDEIARPTQHRHRPGRTV